MPATAMHPMVPDLPKGRIEAQIELNRNVERLGELTYKMLVISSVVADMGIRAVPVAVDFGIGYRG